jgi:hypothetical protein
MQDLRINGLTIFLLASLPTPHVPDYQSILVMYPAAN